MIIISYNYNLIYHMVSLFEKLSIIIVHLIDQIKCTQKSILTLR